MSPGEKEQELGPENNVNNDGMSRSRVSDIAPLNDIQRPESLVSKVNNQNVSNQYPAVVEKTGPQTNFQPNSAQPPVVDPGKPSFTPDKPNKNNKKLIIGGIVAAIVIMLGASTATYAMWFNNPDKVVSDAVSNIISSDTMITSGKVLFADDKNKGKVTVDFSSQSDAPKAAGSLEAKLSIDYPEIKTNIAGAGMVAESGDLYFKIDNASKLFEEYIKTESGVMYTQQFSSSTVTKIKAFVKKIDGQWIKIDKSDLQSVSPELNKQQDCTKDAIKKFYNDSSQKNQISKAYDDNKFIVIKEARGSTTISGQDSTKYDISIDVAKADSFGGATEKTDLAKAIKKCDVSKDLNYSKDQKMTKDEIKNSQKNMDKIKVSVWISRWSHQFTQVAVTTADTESKTNFDFKVELDASKKPSLKDPKSFLKAKDLQKETEDIFGSLVGGYGQPDTAMSSDYNFDSMPVGSRN